MGAIQRISSIGHNCPNAAASSQWYAKTLGFQELDQESFSGGWLAELLQSPEAAIERCRLQLGEEIMELWQFNSAIPAGATQAASALTTCPAGNDGAFQHICIITRDLDQAFALGACRSKQISSAPQRLPDWNPGAGGIWAVKFQDPSGHPLELLQFPPNKGNRRWHEAGPASQMLGMVQDETGPSLFLGLDHTAISVADTQRSLQFYGDLLGMTLAGQGHNHGPEQDGMDGLVGTDVLISSLHPAGEGMGIELLNYRKPDGGKHPRTNPQASDAFEWRIGAVVDDLVGLHERLGGNPQVQQLGPLVSVPAGFGPGNLACQLRDPDGHALLLFADPNS